MKGSIFRRIFLTYAAVLLVSFAVVEFYITSVVRDSRISDLRAGILFQMNLIEPELSFRQKLDDRCRRLKEQTGARVTVIAADGTVLGDSDKDSSEMENHAHRIEIEQAAMGESGMTIRHSDTLGYDFLYVARKAEREGRIAGYLRMAVPLAAVDASVNMLRMRILAVVSVVLMATLVIAFWQTDRLRRLLNQLRDFSRSLAGGDLGRRLHLGAAPEFDSIAADLNTMSTALQTLVEELEEEKDRLNVILASIPDALLIIDNKGIIRIASTSAAAVFGTGKLLGMQYMEAVRNDEFSALIEGVRKHPTPAAAELRLSTPLEKYLSVKVSPLFYQEEEFAGFVAVFHDITQIKQLEAVRKDFVANVSHEIKTPVTAIMGFADTLLEGALDEGKDAVRFLGMIRANSDRINSLVDDLMVISKIELGVIRVEKTQVAAGEVLETVAATLRPRAEEKGLSLKVEIEPKAANIEADRNRLVQILTNLLDNAVKFTEQGGITCGIRMRDGLREIFVEDTGIGIPPKHLPRLGERFYRVDPARSRKLGGTGLGLAIVKHLMKAHGWDMRIESRPGAGTTVRIIL